jgi:hypothetical protein
MKKSEQVARMVRQRLNQQSCELWPLCGCHETLAKYADELSDEGKVWDPEVLAWAETSIFITLACVSRYCPDLETRLYAIRQLQDKWWDRQKAMGLPLQQ